MRVRVWGLNRTVLSRRFCGIIVLDKPRLRVAADLLGCFRATRAHCITYVVFASRLVRCRSFLRIFHYLRVPETANSRVRPPCVHSGFSSGKTRVCFWTFVAGRRCPVNIVRYSVSHGAIASGPERTNERGANSEVFQYDVQRAPKSGASDTCESSANPRHRELTY